MALCMTETAVVLKQFWTCALATSFYAKNRSLHFAHSSISFDMFRGTKPNLNIMQPSEFRAFVYDEGRKKLSNKAQRGKFMG